MTFKKIFWGGFALLSALSSCDKITSPLNPVQQNSTLPNTKPTYTDSSTTASTYKLLLEDVMGHFCSNCPPASQEADSLTENNIHVIAIEDHSGFFAQVPPQYPAPPGLPAGAFTENLQSVVGNYWQNGHPYNFGSWPQGLIDRLYWTQSSPSNMGIDPGKWISVIDSLIAANPRPAVAININDSCWVPQRIIGIRIVLDVPFPLSGSYYLQTLIVEDSCFGWQADQYPYGSFPPGDDSTFDHRFVLRGAVGNNAGGLDWGTQIKSSVISNGGRDTAYLTYDFNRGENGNAANWNMEHCYIVAFVSNVTTYQIIQAEEIKVE